MELTIIASVIGVDFDKKTNERITKYQAAMLENIDNKANYICVKNIEASLHEQFIEDCKKIAQKQQNKSVNNINVIMI